MSTWQSDEIHEISKYLLSNVLSVMEQGGEENMELSGWKRTVPYQNSRLKKRKEKGRDKGIGIRNVDGRGIGRWNERRGEIDEERKGAKLQGHSNDGSMDDHEGITRINSGLFDLLFHRPTLFIDLEPLQVCNPIQYWIPSTPFRSSAIIL